MNRLPREMVRLPIKVRLSCAVRGCQKTFKGFGRPDADTLRAAKEWADRHEERLADRGHSIVDGMVVYSARCKVCKRVVASPSPDALATESETHIVSTACQDAAYERDWLNEVTKALGLPGSESA